MTDLHIPDIVKLWLKENDYDGLAYPEMECCCFLDDFMPCGDNGGKGCTPGHSVDVDGERAMVPERRTK